MRISAYKLMLALLMLMVFLLITVRAGGVLGPAYLLASLAIGVWAILKSPSQYYISFTMLLWMFSPFVRRLVDWQSGRHDYSLVLLAPLAVTLLACLGIPRRMPTSVARLARPFFLCLTVVGYGFMLGLAHGRAFGAIYAAVTWVSPIFFALFIVTRPQENDKIRQALTRTMIVGGFIMSLYGIYQFIAPPPWDAAWIRDAEMNSIGQALPFSIRVFSTMNSPGVFAVAICATLLVSFNRLSPSIVAANAIMVLALALSLVRSSWGATILGLLLLMIFGSTRVKSRVIAILMLVSLAVTPLLMRSEFFDAVSSRFETLTSLEEDNSFKARREFTLNILNDVGALVVGQGLGSTGISSNLTQGSDVIKTFDNGWLALIFTFGVFGSLIITVLLYWLYELLLVLRRRPQSASIAAIPFAMIALLIFANILSGAPGMFVFPFIAAALTTQTSNSMAYTQLQHNKGTELKEAS